MHCFTSCMLLAPAVPMLSAMSDTSSCLTRRSDDVEIVRENLPLNDQVQQQVPTWFVTRGTRRRRSILFDVAHRGPCSAQIVAYMYQYYKCDKFKALPAVYIPGSLAFLLSTCGE